MYWGPYVSVAERRAQARREMKKLKKAGVDVQPVELSGRTIAKSFWGKAWCDHLESFSDYANRLPRGRRYVRNGSVCHLEVQPGRVEAIVSGSELYRVEITIAGLAGDRWRSIKSCCAGKVGSMLELLQGRLSKEVMAVVTDRKQGLFPQPRQIELACSCPDWARMCKHVAAVLYGVGSRLDDRPELLFRLRGVDAEELIAADIALPVAGSKGESLADEQLADIFGIDIDLGSDPLSPSEPPAPAPTTPRAIAGLRARLGLTVLEFSRKLGVSPGSVYRWEAASGSLKLQSRNLEALTRLQSA